MAESLREFILYPVHAMNAEQRQMATDLWTKPTDLSRISLHPPSPFRPIITQPESLQNINIIIIIVTTILVIVNST